MVLTPYYLLFSSFPVTESGRQAILRQGTWEKTNRLWSEKEQGSKLTFSVSSSVSSGST